MATINQAIRRGRRYKVRRTKTKGPVGKPQAKAIVEAVLTMSPKKPNSANRRVVKLRYGDGKKVLAYYPGIGLNDLSPYTWIQISGGKRKDRPGVAYRVLRGGNGGEAKGAPQVEGRISSRSKYGVRNDDHWYAKGMQTVANQLKKRKYNS